MKGVDGFQIPENHSVNNKVEDINIMFQIHR